MLGLQKGKKEINYLQRYNSEQRITPFQFCEKGYRRLEVQAKTKARDQRRYQEKDQGDWGANETAKHFPRLFWEDFRIQDGKTRPIC